MHPLRMQSLQKLGQESVTWEALPDSFNSCIILISKSQARFSNVCQSLKESLSTVHFIPPFISTIYLESPFPAQSEGNSSCYSHQCSSVLLRKYFQFLSTPLSSVSRHQTQLLSIQPYVTSDTIKFPW